MTLAPPLLRFIRALAEVAEADDYLRMRERQRHKSREEIAALAAEPDPFLTDREPPRIIGAT